MSRDRLEQALAGRGYVHDHKANTGSHVCYRKPSGLPKSRAVVFVKRDGSMVACGPSLLTAEPCPEFYNALLGDYRG